MTQSPETPNEKLDRLEAALGRFAELSFQSHRHHDEALVKLETAVTSLTNTLTQVLEITGEHSRAIATNNQRIEEILEYLFRESGNGRSGGG